MLDNINLVEKMPLLNSMTNLSEKIAVIENQIQNIYKEASKFITDDEFDPVKKIVYGMVTAMLLSVVGAVMALIIKK